MQYLAQVFADSNYLKIVSNFCSICTCCLVANIVLDVNVLIDKKPQFDCTILVYDNKWHYVYISYQYKDLFTYMYFLLTMIKAGAML